eukprot:TRINITY_DN44954_c0_g1_i1.p1 TRINITY_DN44954_c0_g1~~TRINITY_DN44954_c0_g1_i1.p1  ORF type:complete len:647 (-),score=88.54 TRINITY_DN44954_c0_g1_i1:76-1971(-)
MDHITQKSIIDDSLELDKGVAACQIELKNVVENGFTQAKDYGTILCEKSSAMNDCSNEESEISIAEDFTELNSELEHAKYISDLISKVSSEWNFSNEVNEEEYQLYVQKWNELSSNEAKHKFIQRIVYFNLGIGQARFITDVTMFALLRGLNGGTYSWEALNILLEFSSLSTFYADCSCLCNSKLKSLIQIFRNNLKPLIQNWDDIENIEENSEAFWYKRTFHDSFSQGLIIAHFIKYGELAGHIISCMDGWDKDSRPEYEVPPMTSIDQYKAMVAGHELFVCEYTMVLFFSRKLVRWAWKNYHYDILNDVIDTYEGVKPLHPLQTTEGRNIFNNAIKDDNHKLVQSWLANVNPKYRLIGLNRIGMQSTLSKAHQYNHFKMFCILLKGADSSLVLSKIKTRKIYRIYNNRLKSIRRELEVRYDKFKNGFNRILLSIMDVLGDASTVEDMREQFKYFKCVFDNSPNELFEDLKIQGIGLKLLACACRQTGSDKDLLKAKQFWPFVEILFKYCDGIELPRSNNEAFIGDLVSLAKCADLNNIYERATMKALLANGWMHTLKDNSKNVLCDFIEIQWRYELCKILYVIEKENLSCDDEDTLFWCGDSIAKECLMWIGEDWLFLNRLVWYTNEYM